MNDFKNNKITLNNETIGELLKKARLEKNYSLQKVSQKTNIRQKYLTALETGQYNLLPAGIYGKNFLRDYAYFLGLDSHELTKELDSTVDVSSNKAPLDPFKKKLPKFQYFLSIPKIFKNLIISVSVIMCVLYLGIFINKIISPPYLEIFYPQKDLTINATSLTITGKTDKMATVIINGKTVLISKTGDFSQKINLKSDVNTITIIANKKYSKKQIIIRKIIVKNK